jgi:hypothetical protein
MVETIQILDFLKYGQFGNSKYIYFGMNRSDLKNILGETDYLFFTDQKSKYPSIYKYGKVEFYFEEGINGRLFGIQIKPTIDEAPLLNLNINYGFIESSLNFEQTLNHLESNSIEYEQFDFKYDDLDDPKRIITKGEVQLIFDMEFGIEKVNKFVELESQDPTEKQINLSIPKSKYDILRKESLYTGVSIQKICSKIIINSLKE